MIIFETNLLEKSPQTMIYIIIPRNLFYLQDITSTLSPRTDSPTPQLRFRVQFSQWVPTANVLNSGITCLVRTCTCLICMCNKVCHTYM